MAALPAIANAASLFSYPWTATAKVVDGDREFTAYIHPKEDAILLQPRMAKIMGGRTDKWPIAIWRHAAESFVGPVGCGISEVRAVARMGASWEATFVCPAGVDLRELAKAQHADLIEGMPLHP